VTARDPAIGRSLPFNVRQWRSNRQVVEWRAATLIPDRASVLIASTDPFPTLVTALAERGCSIVGPDSASISDSPGPARTRAEILDLRRSRTAAQYDCIVLVCATRGADAEPFLRAAADLIRGDGYVIAIFLDGHGDAAVATTPSNVWSPASIESICQSAGCMVGHVEGINESSLQPVANARREAGGLACAHVAAVFPLTRRRLATVRERTRSLERQAEVFRDALQNSQRAESALEERLRAGDAERAAIEDELKDRDARSSRQQSVIDVLTARGEAARADLASARSRIEAMSADYEAERIRLRAELEDLEERRSSVAVALRDAREQGRALEGRLADAAERERVLASRLADAGESVTKLDGTIVDLEQRLEASRRASESLSDRLGEAHAELARIHESLIWRASGPFRRLAGRVAGLLRGADG
jgi:predicted  nucleic acid-binding Zn-ribbon protein